MPPIAIKYKAKLWWDVETMSWGICHDAAEDLKSFFASLRSTCCSVLVISLVVACPKQA